MAHLNILRFNLRIVYRMYRERRENRLFINQVNEYDLEVSDLCGRMFLKK